MLDSTPPSLFAWNEKTNSFQLVDWNEIQKNALRDEFHPIALEGKRRVVCAKRPSLLDLWCAQYRAVWENVPLLLLPTNNSLEVNSLKEKIPAEFPEETKLIIFTSGTTGNSRPIFHGDASLRASCRQLLLFAGELKSIYCTLHPWSMAGAIFQLFLPLYSGAGLYFTPEMFLFDPKNLNFHGSNQWIVTNPYQLGFLLKQGARFSSRVVSFTDSLPSSTRELFTRNSEPFGGELLEGYGMTECAGPVWIEGTSLGAKLTLSEEGELLIEGKQVALGFGEGKVFRAFPPLLKTHDLFARNGQGFKFLSRQKDLILQSGTKIFPSFIEELIRGFEAIDDVIVFPYADATGFFYTVKQNNNSNAIAKELSVWVQKSISAHWRPIIWKKVEAIPRTTRGKPDRAKAAELASSEFTQ